MCLFENQKRKKEINKVTQIPTFIIKLICFGENHLKKKKKGVQFNDKDFIFHRIKRFQISLFYIIFLLRIMYYLL